MVGENIHLFVREQKTSDSGDLVFFTSSDFYNEKIDFLKSLAGDVIYNGSLVIEYPFVYTHYSSHSYKEGRLVGYKVVKYDLERKVMVSSCDLESHLDENYFSNRPAGLGISEGTLYLATAWFNLPVTYEKAEMKVFSEINKILILSGSADTCSFEVLHHAKTLIPYYDTNISILGDKYLYFQDGNKIVSNINNIESCAIKEKSIYPYLLAGNSFVYASILNKYKIRDFNTSVSACIKIKDKDEN